MNQNRRHWKPDSKEETLKNRDTFKMQSFETMTSIASRDIYFKDSAYQITNTDRENAYIFMYVLLGFKRSRFVLTEKNVAKRR